MKPISILLVDDHAAVRAGLQALIETVDDMQIIGQAENGQEAVREAERLRPDVVLLDLAMPLLNGVEAARQIARKVPKAKVLILSSYSDPMHLRQAVEAGVAGYLMKESAAADLLKAVRDTAHGAAAFSPPLFPRLLGQLHSVHPGGPRAATRRPNLSCREAQILQLIAEGYASKQIAGLLSLALKTVEKYRQSLMGRLNCRNIATLTRYAVANGVVELNDCPGDAAGRPLWGLVRPGMIVIREGADRAEACKQTVLVTWGAPIAAWSKTITFGKIKNRLVFASPKGDEVKCNEDDSTSFPSH